MTHVFLEYVNLISGLTPTPIHSPLPVTHTALVTLDASMKKTAGLAISRSRFHAEAIVEKNLKLLGLHGSYFLPFKVTGMCTAAVQALTVRLSPYTPTLPGHSQFIFY